MQRILIPGSSNPALARSVARGAEMPLARVESRLFQDGERFVQILSQVRGKEIFILQSGYASAQEHLVELFLLVDAAKREGAKRITAIIPYLPFRKAERKIRPGEAISLSVVARTLELLGVRKTIVVDLHEPSSTQLFKYPVVNLLPFDLYATAIRRLKLTNPVVAGADGSVSRHAQALAERLHCASVAFTKKRKKAEHVHRVSLDSKLRGKDVILIDDEVNTGGTIVACTKRLRKDKVRSITVVAAHAILPHDAAKKLSACGIDHFITTNTIPQTPQKISGMIVVSVAPLIAEALQ